MIIRARETKMLNGLNIIEITKGLLSNVANCKETGVHL